MELKLIFSYSFADSEADPGRAAELAKVAAYPQAPTRKLKADESHIFNGKFH
jgi:FKBP12-rapamycin complex-associated protein